MARFLFLVVSVPAGFVLGVLYFGSLWITVRQLPSTAIPIRLFVGGFISRLLIAGLGFYLIMDGQWQQALAALGGFLAARTLLIRRLGITDQEG